MENDRQSHDVEFVEYVVKSIVDHPDDVKLERTIDEMGVLITLAVNPEDMGQIIGRQGATAKSIRTLLRVIGARNNARVNLKINEPEGSTRNVRGAEGVAVPAEGTPSEAVTVEAPAADAAPVAEKPKQSVEEALDDLDL
ncbi:MAG: KH domain-containing protein [bacterium]|nr:KH domain-containing protein [bacterium]